MCKRFVHHSKRAAYRAETIQLQPERHARSWQAFPWWMLWLIWPTIWMFKGLAALFGSLAISTSPLTALAGVVLIAAGIALMIADRTSRDD